MKRTIAILLAALMLVGIAPASLLTASAHGTGVGKNSFDNLSIDNAPEQDIASTIAVDGKSNDTAWKYEDWNSVGAANGTWSVTTPKNTSFGYKYQLHTDYQYLYGIFVIDTNTLYKGELGDVTVWLNDSAQTRYTDKIVLKTDGTCTVYNYATVATDKGLDTVNATLSAVTEENGVYIIEFRTLISNITDNESAVLKSYVSVDVNIDSATEQLYYPRFSVSDSDSGIDPATAWPSNSISITEMDVLAAHLAGGWGAKNGNFSEILPNEIRVDGELNEGIWENFTSFYRVDTDIFDYREGTTPHSQDGYDFTDLSVGYCDSMYYYDYEDGKVNVPRTSASGETALDDPVVFNNYSINGDKTKTATYLYDAQYKDFYETAVKFKYDVRTTDKYFYGAMLAYIDCNDKEFYYHIKKYEDDLAAQGKTPSDGDTLSVPAFFYVVFPTYTGGTAYTLKVRYDSDVAYCASNGNWEYTGDGRIIYGQDGKYPYDDYAYTGLSGGISGFTANVRNCVGVQRLGRYLISLEFKFSLEELLILKDGKYLDEDSLSYNSDYFDIAHTLAVANVPSMYHYYPHDLAASGGEVTKHIEFYSYGYVNDQGEAVRYASGDYIEKSGTKIYAQQDGTLWRVLESDFNFTYPDTFENGYYAYHAWSMGGGTGSSKPIRAQAGLDVAGPGTTGMTGYLEPEYWANLLAADALINGMGRSSSTNTDNDYDDFIAKGEADYTDGIVGSFYQELYADSEYLYGAALIVDDDGEWRTKSASGSTDYDVFRIWLNNGEAQWGDAYEYVINFYINSYYNDTVGNIPVCDIHTQSGNTKIATSLSASEEKGGTSNSDGDEQKKGYGIEVEMRIVEDYVLRDIRTRDDLVGFGTVTTDLAVLEFKIPLDIIGLSGEISDETLTNYVVSMETYSDGGKKGLCWPLQDNGNLELGSDINTITYPIDRMYLNPWNARNDATILYSDRLASTVVIDGNPAEEIWNNADERHSVDVNNGTWDSMPLGKDIFDYQYQVYTGRQYVYGMAEINAIADSSTAFNLWINADGSSTATHRYEFRIEDGVGVCYETEIASGTRTKVTFSNSKGANGGMAMHTLNGKTYLEFMLPMDEFETVRDGYKYVVSVSHNGNSLFHPDNTNIASGQTTNTLWLTHYNALFSGGGCVILDPASLRSTSLHYYSRGYFVPTEYEGIYKLEKYFASNVDAKVGDELTSVFGSDIPEGTFIYAVSGGNPNTNVPGYGIKNTLVYGAPAGTKFSSVFNGKEGCYVRFEGLDFDTYRINTLYDDQWNSDAPYFIYGHGTDATYTVVDIGDSRDGSFPAQLKWDSVNAETITKVDRFIPEKITVDGDLSDTGWSDDKWINVVDGQNGNTQNSGYNYCDEFDSYKYQIRTDGEYVYVAAIVDTPGEVGSFGDLNGGEGSKEATPAFRIWIQSQNSKYDGAVSFTHLFDIRPGTTTLSVVTDKVNSQINKYNNHYLPVLDGANHIGSSNNSGVAEGTKVEADINANANHTVNSGSLIYDAAIRAAENVNGLFVPQGGLGGTVVNKNYGDSVFYGETVFDTENLNTAVGYNEYQSAWFAKIDIENMIYGNECASYKSVGDKMQVEFRFALADIGCEDGSDFEYYVEARSQQAVEADSYILFHPSLPTESCVWDGDYTRSFHFPFWVWGNTAMTFDNEAGMLRNPMEPVSVLGAQSDEGYYDAQGIHGLKVGVLYNQDYLDMVHNDGANFWDAKEIGMLVALSKNLKLEGNDTALYVGTSGAANVPSDAIQDHVGGTNMADYSSYVFYSYVKIRENMVDTDITYRAYVEFYPSDDLYYDHPWLTGGISEDGKDGWTYRPTYYSNVITRNYNLVAGITNGGEGGEGGGEEVLPDPDPISIPVNVVKTLTNAGGEIYSAGCSGFNFQLVNSSNSVKVLSCVSDVNGNATATLEYTKDDIGKTYNYILSETNDGEPGMVYSDSKYYITVKIGYDGNNNKLTYTLTNNSASVTEINATFGNTYNFTNDNGTSVVYVPLDNRPVNIDRIEYLAQATGINLIVPPVEYFSNTLDNDADTSTNASDAGNPADILNWLKTDPEVQKANNFVISLDMLFSGGLIGSRDPFYDSAYSGNVDSVASLGANNSLLANGSYVLSDKEKEIANYIIELAGEKNVFLFDTVMRLATTGNYGNANDSAYDTFRDIYADAERPILSGSDLTIDNIVANYDKFIDGTTVTTSGSNVIVTPSGGTSVTIDAEYKQLYNLARERKLRLVDYLVKNKDLNGDGVADIDYDVLDKLCGMYIGVDDSKDNNNMQLNERNYITNVLFANSDALLFEGADELGLVGISDCITHLHGDVSVKLRYFGDGENWTADAFGYGTLGECIDKHVIASGAVEVTSGADMEILILTRSAQSLSATDATAHANNISSLISQLKTNLTNGVPTCVIDGSAYAGYGPLADAILALADQGYNITNILGFSAWNTTGNATGIAMGNAVARCSYLKNVANVTETSNYGFLKSIAYSFIKDDVYKKETASCYADPSHFYTSADTWLAGLNKSAGVITKISNGKATAYSSAYDVRVSNLKFPWNRNFEADFDVTVVTDANSVNLVGSGSGITHSTVTGAANYSTFATANSWWWGHATGTTDTTDTNEHPWAQWYTAGDKLTDGVTYDELGPNSTAAERKARWFGMAYRGQVTNDSTPETNAGTSGVCPLPSIKFGTAQNIDQLKMHFLYYEGGQVYLPESITVYFYDADGGTIGVETISNIRDVEATVLSLTTSKHQGHWVNMPLSKVYENVSTVTIRPLIPKRAHATYDNLRGWVLTDEIEVYNTGKVLDTDGSSN